VIYFRYGSFTDFSRKVLSFSDVGRLSGIPQETVRRQLIQFVKDGHQVFMRRMYNGDVGSNSKITP
jgi:hypothetical protein